jgi:hypothetical protein
MRCTLRVFVLDFNVASLHFGLFLERWNVKYSDWNQNPSVFVGKAKRLGLFDIQFELKLDFTTKIF